MILMFDTRVDDHDLAFVRQYPTKVVDAISDVHHERYRMTGGIKYVLCHARDYAIFRNRQPDYLGPVIIYSGGGLRTSEQVAIRHNGYVKSQVAKALDLGVFRRRLRSYLEHGGNDIRLDEDPSELVRHFLMTLLPYCLAPCKEAPIVSRESLQTKDFIGRDLNRDALAAPFYAKADLPKVVDEVGAWPYGPDGSDLYKDDIWAALATATDTQQFSERLRVLRDSFLEWAKDY